MDLKYFRCEEASPMDGSPEGLRSIEGDTLTWKVSDYTKRE